MDYVNQLEKTEVILIGGITIALLAFTGGFIGYESITNFSAVKETAQLTGGVLESAIGEPLIKETVEIGKEPIQIVGDIERDGLSYAKAKYEERRLPLSSQWIAILGADVYNDGFGSIRYAALRENGSHLDEVYKESPFQYFSSLTVAQRAGFIWNTPFDDDPLHVISPFKIRQQLEKTPFHADLHGLFGSDVNSLKEFIWTDYDKVPNQMKNWKELSVNEKIKVINLIKKDRILADAMEESNHYNAWIVRDRVLNYNDLLIFYNINI